LLALRIPLRKAVDAPLMLLDPTLECTCEAGRAARRAMHADLQLARDVQQTLVPHPIEADGVRVAVRNLPCSYVGGDYLQASFARPDVLHLCVADVSGHGVAAALVVARLHGHVRRLILEDRSPRAYLSELDVAAARIFRHAPFFLTFAVFRVDLAARRIEYATAGHPAQVLLRSAGGVDLLSTPNRLLGIGGAALDAKASAGCVRYDDGDALVLFTDGLFEVPGRDGCRLDEEHLHQRLASASPRHPDAVLAAATAHLGDVGHPTRFPDDVSVMVAHFGRPPTAVGA
jgi:phosphoserine phosphatase RsbU/P